MHDAVIELDHEHELLVAANDLADELAVLHFVIIKSLGISSMIFIILLDLRVRVIVCRNDADITVEDVDGLLDDVLVCFVGLLIISKPWIHLDAHKAAHLVLVFVFCVHIFYAFNVIACSAFDKYHDVTVGFFGFLKALLLHHLRVVHKADELPVAQVNDALRHVVS